MRLWVWLLGREVVGSWVTRLAPLVVVAGVTASWSASSPGLFVWENRTSAIITSLAILVPMLAGLAAWDATRVRRQGLRWMWRSARDCGWRAVLGLAIAQILVAVLAFSLVAALTYVPVGVPGVPVGQPMWGWLCSGAAACVLAVAAGLFLGLAAPFLPTILLTPIVVYAGGAALFLLAAPGLETNGSRLSPMFQMLVNEYARIDEGPFLRQAAWFVSAAASLVLWSVLLVAYRRREAWLLGSSCLLLAVATAVGVAHDGTHISSGAQAKAFSCNGRAPRLCLTPDYEPERAVLYEALAQAHHRTAGTPLAFERVELLPRGVEPSSAEAVELHVDDLSSGWQVRDLAEFALGRLGAGPGGFCAGVAIRSAEGRDYGASLVIAAWVSGDTGVLGGDEDLERASASFERRDRAEKREWLTTNRIAVCDGTFDVGRI